MPKKDHCIILEQGVEKWNQWRADNQLITPDLSSENHILSHFSGANFIEANLNETNLSKADLSQANLSQAKLRQAKLLFANLSGANLSGANLLKADLSRANLTGANLTGADLTGADLTGADLTGADLSRVKFSQSDFSYANLSGVDLSSGDLSYAKFVLADLRQANLSSTKFHGVNLSSAKLNEANLRGANLTETNLVFADLTDADLADADLTGADLSHATLRQSNFTNIKIGWTVFADVDFNEVKGLETIKHTGPTSIGIDTIYRSKGKIPEVFLRGAGVPEDLITYIESFVMGQSIQFYSCFISYSSQDQLFAERLHADLQAKGVRCWFAPKNMKTGDEIRPTIDQAIHLHDKVLVVLSEHSLNSWWVKKEVETAFERESKDNQLVLFPVRLDNTVMLANQAWAADIRRIKHIGDFTKWEHHTHYREAFERLLLDLKAGTKAQT